jgi:hypothetical protein
MPPRCRHSGPFGEINAIFTVQLLPAARPASRHGCESARAARRGRTIVPGADTILCDGVYTAAGLDGSAEAVAQLVNPGESGLVAGARSHNRTHTRSGGFRGGANRPLGKVGLRDGSGLGDWYDAPIPEGKPMRLIVCIALTLVTGSSITFGQGTPRTLVAVWAHADDKTPVGPVLARYAREGVKVYMIITTDGSQGAANTSVPRGPEIAKLRVEEARCSAQALGIQPPILLG